MMISKPKQQQIKMDVSDGNTTEISYESKIKDFISEIKSRNDLIRDKGIEHLKQFIHNLIENSSDELSTFVNLFNDKIFELMIGPGSNDVNEVKAGIICMILLLDTETPDAKSEVPSNNFIRYANYLRNLNPFPNDAQTIELAAYAIGRIALKTTGPMTGKFVDFEMKRAIELIQSEAKNEAKKDAAVS